MRTCEIKEARNSVVQRLTVVTVAAYAGIGAAVLATSPAYAEEGMAPAVVATEAHETVSAALEPAPATFPKVGGHIGVATPLVTIADETTTIADAAAMLNPIGVSVVLSEKVVVDFETVVVTPIDPGGSPGFVVDPGVVYKWPAFATGLRVAWQIHPARPAIGLIPLINRGLVDLGGATWFVEAAFPTFYRSATEDIEFNVVLHTGVGF